MKTITIRLPDAEAVMLAAAQKKDHRFRNLESLLISLIRDEYYNSGSSRGRHR